MIINQWLVIMAVIIAIVIHESGHILMAKCMGITIESIDIMPCGGAIHMASFFKLSLHDEVILCLAGPVANLFSAMICSVIINLGLPVNGFLSLFMAISMGLCLFNLFPALPLDGGRVLRAALARSMPIKKAGKVAALVGYTLGAGLFACGLYVAIHGEYNIMLFIMSYFVVVGAKEEQKNIAYALMKSISRKNQLVMQNGCIENKRLTVYGDILLSQVIKNFSSGKLHHLTIVDENMAVIGYLTEKEVIEGATVRGSQIKIASLWHYLHNKDKK
jgi:stage IV sporulation protein FB